MKEKFNVWMPISKSANGGFVGILSDTSLDRDEEFMTKELLAGWAADPTPLPMLANHENKIEKLIGGWTDKRLITNKGHSALVANPFFFSKEANPLAAQIQKQVEEALAKGLNIGISIGAIPKETVRKEIDGVKKLGYKKAEIVEATIVPIQSNRNASFTNIAKSFDINFNKDLEDNTMTEEQIEAPKEEVQEQPEHVEETKEEVTEEVSEEKGDLEEKVEAEAPKEEEKAEVVEAEAEDKLSDEDAQKLVNENKSLSEKLDKALARIEKLEGEVVIKGTVEGPLVNKEKAEEIKKGASEEEATEYYTLEKQIADRFKLNK